MRVEKDALGEKNIPESALWGVQTARAKENFPVSGESVDPILIGAYAELKVASAQANIELGLLGPLIGKAVLKAAREVIEGRHAKEFVVDQYQAGAGTSTNMNLNEVIANRALTLLGKKKGSYDVISPNDHVNMSQSTNDTYPSATRIALALEFRAFDRKLKVLEDSFMQKGREFRSFIKSARTHLQDAVPITLGQEFTAYGRTISEVRANLARAKDSIMSLGIGGSAAGTGLNTHPRYARLVVRNLKKNTGERFRNAPDPVESMQSQKQLLEFASALKLAAVEISRIASDLRLLSSGPNTGLGEIVLPAVQPGSSAMPGKVNPSILECVNMVCFRVIGAEAAVGHAVLAGQLDLNINMPLMASELLHAIKILGNAAEIMGKFCVRGIRADRKRMEQYAYTSAALATALTPILGYAKVAEIVKEFIQTREPLPDIILRRKLLTKAEIKNIFNISRLTRPGIAKRKP